MKKFIYSIFLSILIFVKRNKNPDGDLLVIVVPPSNNGWILNSIGREIGERIIGMRVIYAHSDQKIPKAKNYLFLHYMYFFNCIVKNPKILFNSFNVVYMTHFESSKFGINNEIIIKILKLADKIVCMNTAMKKSLENYNINKEYISVNIGGADIKVFKSDIVTKKIYIGISSAYYLRKNPDLIFKVISIMGDYNFILLGKGWQNYENFNILKNLENFQYIETDYKNYPEWYQRMKVYFSASLLEGGPIPLIESMMSGAIPVVSNTGFASDLIDNGRNGFIFSLNEPIENIVSYLKLAYEMENISDVELTKYSWENFAHRFNKLFVKNYENK